VDGWSAEPSFISQFQNRLHLTDKLRRNRSHLDEDTSLIVKGGVVISGQRVAGLGYLLLETRQAFDAPPKTDAGKRTVTIPPHVMPILVAHMREWSGSDRVFIGRDGEPMRGDAIRQAFTRARRKVGLPGFRFHDLRHTGQTLAASAGATLKDLMRRLGQGGDHPDTLTAAFHLAAELTEYQAARELNEDILARRRRVLGGDHPETMGSAAFDLILRGLAIGGEPEWMAALREAHKRPGS
jgi:hypothetical protein